MKLVRTKFFIQTFRLSNPEHPLFARRGRNTKWWSFWEGIPNQTHFDTESEAVRTARYFTKTRAGHGYSEFEVVRVEVIERETVIWPKPDVVAHLAQLAPAVYETPVPARVAVSK